MVNCQPSFSLPCPNHFTRCGVIAVTNMLPAKAKINRNPLIVVRSWGSLDNTPDRAL